MSAYSKPIQNCIHWLVLLFFSGPLLDVPAQVLPPVFISQPKPQAAILNGRAIFTVMASGTAPISYQWRRGSAPLSGNTNEVLILKNVQFSDAGQYSVVVSNADGLAVSTNAGLVVNWPRAGDWDLSFDAGSTINGIVYSVAEQPDGKVIIAGDFTGTSGALRGRVARLNPGGSMDHTFMNGCAGADGVIYSVAVQPDGKVLIGGAFTNVNGVLRTNLARLNADGTLDASFQNGLSGPNNAVMTLRIQNDGKVLIGGWFTALHGVSRNRIARLNQDGTLDSDFQNGLAGASYVVRSLCVQRDGKILLGGMFALVNGVSRPSLARMNTDGTLDTTFLAGLAGPNSTVHSLAIQEDDKILIGGSFGSLNGVERHGIARLHVDGTVDSSFQNGLAGVSYGAYSGTIESLALQSDGKVLIGGWFTNVNGAIRNYIARLNSDGTLDNAFQDNLAGVGGNNPVLYCLHLQTNGQVIIGGNFATVNGLGRQYLARLHQDGTLDAAFQNGPAGINEQAGSIFALALQADGKVLLGGSVISTNGPRSRLLRLTADGALDPAFVPGSLSGPDGTVISSVAVQTNQKILITGDFYSINGIARDGIARLNQDGTVDLSFQSAIPPLRTNGIFRLFPQADGKVLLLKETSLCRLNEDGSLDGTFRNDPQLNVYLIFSVAIQRDGKILLGGSFNLVNGVPGKRLARLNVDGTLDQSFLNGLSGPNEEVWSVAVQKDGKLVIGGLFTTVNGVLRNRIARLNSDGSLDTIFQNGAAGANSWIWNVVLQNDGKILISGFFSTINGIPRNRWARLNTDGTLDTTFFLDDIEGIRAFVLQNDGKMLFAGNLLAANHDGAAFVTRIWADTPKLIVHKNPGLAQMTLQWSTNCMGLSLQAISDFQSGAAWETVTNQPVVNGSDFILDLPASTQSKFFRLIAAP